MRGRTKFRIAKPIFQAGGCILKLVPAIVCRGMLVCCRHLPGIVGIGVRYLLVRSLARSCGQNVFIGEGTYIFRLQNVDIGDNVSIHPMCYIDGTGGITIGSNVAIAHSATIMSTEHIFSHPEKAIIDSGTYKSKVIINDDVWIGAGVRILAGVSVGSHSVIAAGAVVVKDVPSRCVAGGVPARIIKSI